jgi:hypothetical protein
MLDAVKRLMLRETRRQPLLVIFEDLHWIDGETQAFLDSLIDSLGSARLFLLVNYRPEYQHGWSRKTYYGEMRLDVLPPESTGELLDALLGRDPGLEPLKQRLVRRGNPFFLEETVQTLAETNALSGERGSYRLTRPVHAIRVPATVQTVLAARIDRLAPEDKRLLQTASVVGRDVPFALLHAVADLPDDALRGGLDRLQSAEFLYETGLFPDLELFLQACAYPRRHLRRTAAGPSSGASRADRRCDRGAVWRPSGRARRTAGRSRRHGRALGHGGTLFPGSRPQGEREVRQPGCREPFAEAPAHANEALRIAEAAHHAYSISAELHCIGIIHLLRGCEFFDFCEASAKTARGRRG